MNRKLIQFPILMEMIESSLFVVSSVLTLGNLVVLLLVLLLVARYFPRIPIPLLVFCIKHYASHLMQIHYDNISHMSIRLLPTT